MKLDAYASAPQYLEHMAPVWRALRKRSRGAFYVAPDVQALAASMGLETRLAPVAPGGPILVAASGNLNHVVLHGREHRAIMEHGAGLSYGGDRSQRGRVAATSSSYAGGDHRPAQLFLHPGEHPAARDRARYPGARVEVVGCPKLDTLPARVVDGVPTVAFSFHWDTNISPETRSAFLFYRDHLAELARAARGRFRIIGHGHPRIFDRLAPWYARKGIEAVRSFDEVCRRADVYAVDNSSTLYEFASTGRPVIVLNAPFYRRDVHHGLRFWEDAGVGENVDEPYDIGEAVNRALFGHDAHAPAREAAVGHVYAHRTGAAKRAALVLEDWASSLS